MKKFLLSIFAVFFVTTSLFSQAVLENEVVQKVMSSVFEIVIDKVEDTSITYEKELPFDRLPYAVRTDKYNPIGTAFLLEDGTFYSASHVFALYGDTVYKNYYIRDSEGKTYPIKDITTLSNRRDFISFTVPTYTKKQGTGLKVNKKYLMNTVVYSVGNAQGEGIVIRDGILTSKTPENRDGDWKWLRFSAAASPGNSGGPLINAKGEVIGIVTMKNQNENLNYALPIEEIDTGKNGVGIIDTKFSYQLPNIANKKEFCDFVYNVKLPMNYTVLHDEITVAYKENIKKTVDIMSKKYAPTASESFDKAKGKAEFFSNSFSTNFPYIVYLNENGNWNYGGVNTKSYQLEENGVVEYCSMMGYTMAKITKPDNITLEQLVSSPKTYIEYIIDATKMYRTVGGEEIHIKSLGNPVKSEKHEDFFGRTWFVNYFNVDFADSMLLSFAIPLPDGVFVFYKTDSRDDIISSHYLDMKFVTDFVYTSYFGTVANWKEYLALPESLVGARKSNEGAIKVATEGKNLLITTEDFNINIPNSVIKFDDDTRISITNSYALKDDKLTIENRSICIYTDPKKNNYRYAYIRRFDQPSEDALEKTKKTYSQLLNKVSPYDGDPYNHEQYTYCDTVIIPQSESDPKNAKHLYLICMELQNQNKFKDITKFTNEYKKCIEVK